MSRLSEAIHKHFGDDISPEQLFLQLAGEAGPETVEFAQRVIMALDGIDGTLDGRISGSGWITGDVKRELAVKLIDAALKAAGVNGIARRIIRALVEQYVVRAKRNQPDSDTVGGRSFDLAKVTGSAASAALANSAQSNVESSIKTVSD